MHITLTKDYSVKADTTLLGYQGETNSRKITFSGLVVDGCDLYKLQILYSDGKVYELPIQDEVVTITGSILREIGYVSCQLFGYSVSGNDYTIVFKSNIFELEIKEAIDGEVAPIPPYEEVTGALEKILAGVEAAKGYSESAETSANHAETARAEAVKSQNGAKVSAAQASTAAQQTEADKVITAGYAKTAKENADSTASDRQEVQTLAEQVTVDKATVAENASKVAEDRTAAETAAQTAMRYAESAETSADNAETARQQAVTSQNAAKISADQASASAQQTTADKTATAGYAQTAKTNADSTAADRQAVQTLAEQVTADKAIVADHAAQVAEDRTAAETAAQTARSIADSLPEDYVTAVAKIAKNTAEIGRVKLTDKELQRRVNALYDMGNGVTHQFETDTDTAYAKTIPAGSKLMSVKSVGGHSEVIDGEIVSAGVTEVVEQGRNLFDVEKCAALGLYYGFEIDTNKTLQIALKDGKTCPTNVSFGIAYIRGNTMANWLITSQGLVETKTDSSKMTDSTQIMVVCYPGNKETMQSIADAFDIMLVDGIYKPDTMPAYAPFHRNEYPIPDAIKALPGYGWSAGTARNYIDYENKRYVQCVGKYTFTGNEDWVASGDNQYYAVLKTPATKVFDMNTKSNCLMATIPTETVNSVYGGTKTGLGINFLNNVSYAYISADDYNNRVSKINGQDMYYELANPIVTDISNLTDDEFLRNIEVEAGGSITFKNSNGDSYRIPVPSEEEYIVKLSEVGGSV